MGGDTARSRRGSGTTRKAPPLCSLIVLVVGTSLSAVCGQDALELANTIPLTRVTGRIDHMSVDLNGRRLFVAALGNGSVEIVGLGEGRIIHSITGLREPQGILYIPDKNTLVVATGGDGACTFYDASSFHPLGTISLGEDADNVRYDAAGHLLYVGYGNGGLAVIDPSARRKVAAIPLPAHPESFQLEQNGGRIFVNIPGAEQVAALNRVTYSVAGRFRLSTAHGNYPMAFDQERHRLFIGCRDPARLLIMDTDSGGVRATVDIDGDCDDVFFDAGTDRLYLSCGSGFLNIVAHSAPDTYVLRSRVKTATGARTSLFVPEWQKLFVAVPRRGKKSAEILIYTLKK